MKKYNLTISTTMNATFNDSWRCREFPYLTLLQLKKLLFANKNHAIKMIVTEEHLFHQYTLTFNGNYIEIHKIYIGNLVKNRLAIGSLETTQVTYMTLLSEKSYAVVNLLLAPYIILS